MNRGRVIPDGVLAGEEQTRDRLRRGGKRKNHTERDVGLSQHNKKGKWGLERTRDGGGVVVTSCQKSSVNT